MNGNLDKSDAQVIYAQFLSTGAACASMRSSRMRLQGLSPKALYEADGRKYLGETLMYAGLLRQRLEGGCQAEVIEIRQIGELNE